MQDEGRLFTETDNSNLLDCDYEDLISKLEEQVEDQEQKVNEQQSIFVLKDHECDQLKLEVKSLDAKLTVFQQNCHKMEEQFQNERDGYEEKIQEKVRQNQELQNNYDILKQQWFEFKIDMNR